MSESKSKKDRKLKLMTEEAGLDETAREMAKSISKMYEDRDKKAVGAKAHLVDQLRITADKYRTANGVMAALDTVRQVFGEHQLGIDESMDIAKSTAKYMARVATDMATRAEAIEPDDMDQLCDGFYNKEFADSVAVAIDMVDELMALQLCQNVGPNAEDVAQFCHTADDEIEKARKELMTFCNENGLDFHELCGPHDRCPACLCADCVRDCKDGREIMVGQSAYDVCKDFEADICKDFEVIED